MDRKGVEALLADAPPIPVGPHEPFIDPKAGLFADGTLDRVQAPFYFLLSDSDHVGAGTFHVIGAELSITGGEMESQPRRRRWYYLDAALGKVILTTPCI